MVASKVNTKHRTTKPTATKSLVKNVPPPPPHSHAVHHGTCTACGTPSRYQRTRGTCRACYMSLTRAVRRKLFTWAELVAAGVCHEPHDTTHNSKIVAILDRFPALRGRLAGGKEVAAAVEAALPVVAPNRPSAGPGVGHASHRRRLRFAVC